MIRSFKNRDTKQIFRGTFVRSVPVEIQRRARMKLRMLDSAVEIRDLSSPPGNMLERLKRDREGQHSIRINLKWRICFTWYEGNAYEVEITDYH